MTRLTRLPRVALVPKSESDRLARKVEAAREAQRRDRFWQAVQAMKQPGARR